MQIMRNVKAELRRFFRNKWSYPNGWLKARRFDFGEKLWSVAPKGRTRVEPVAHFGLVAIVDLDVSHRRQPLLGHGQIAADIVGRNKFIKIVPPTPPRWRVFGSTRGCEPCTSSATFRKATLLSLGPKQVNCFSDQMQKTSFSHPRSFYHVNT